MVTSTKNGATDKERSAQAMQKGKPFPSLLPKAFSMIEHVVSVWWSGALIAFMTLFICTEVISRYLFNYPLMGVADIIELSVIVIAFAALSGVQRQNAHIRMDLLPSKLSRRRAGRIIESVNLLMGMAAFVFVLYAVAGHTLGLYQEGGATEMVHLPLWPAALFMPIGCLLLCIRLGIQVKRCL